MAAVAGGNGQSHGKRAAAGLHNGLPFGQKPLLGRQRQHPLGKTVLGAAGGTAEIQIGQNAALQPMVRTITPQRHHRVMVQMFVVIFQHRHGRFLLCTPKTLAI